MFKLRFWAKVIGRGVGLGSIIIWLVILVNAHLINNYGVILYLNNFNEAWPEVTLLSIGLVALSYDIYTMKKMS